MLVSSYITPKARKGVSSAIQGRGLVAVAPIADGELVAIKGGHIVTTAALPVLDHHSCRCAVRSNGRISCGACRQGIRSHGAGRACAR